MAETVSVDVFYSGQCPGCGLENCTKVSTHVIPGQAATVVQAATCRNTECNTVFQVTGYA